MSDDELSEIRVFMARIDERTENMAKDAVRTTKWLNDHEDRDREDFKEVHDRIDVVAERQNKTIGVGAGIAFLFTTVLTYLGLGGGSN